MNRIQEMNEYLTSFRYDWIKKKVDVCKSKPLPVLQDKAEIVLSNVKKAQVEGDSRPLCFVCLFHFRSSVWTGSYRYQIGAFDDALYLYKPLASADFVPEQLYDDVPELSNAVEVELKKKFVRLTPFELHSAVRGVLLEYQKLAEVYWNQIAGVLVYSDVFQAILKQENWKFLSGTYMDELNIILQAEKGR